MATPPYNPDQSSPQASDLISQFPADEQNFRDIIESWLLSISTSAGVLKSSAFPTVGDFTVAVRGGPISMGSVSGDGTGIGKVYHHDANDSEVYYLGGADTEDAAYLRLFGNTHATLPSRAQLKGDPIALVDIDGDVMAIFDPSGFEFEHSIAMADDTAIFFGGTGAATTRTNLGLGTASNVTFATVTAGGTSVIGNIGMLTGGMFRSGSGTDFVRISGGSGTGLGGRSLWYGQGHATMASQISHAAGTTNFFAGDGTTELMTLNGASLTMGTDIDIVFAGNGASATRTNLGLGTMAIRDNGTAADQYRNNQAAESYYDTQYFGLTDILPSAQLPTSAGANQWVREEVAKFLATGVGSYAMFKYHGTGTGLPGTTITSTGSNLSYASASGDSGVYAANGQVWRVMGYRMDGADTDERTLYLRTA